jgi:hypothetical protein
MESAERSIAAFDRLAEHHDLPTARWYRSLHKALVSHMRGALDETERHAWEFLARGQEVGDRNAILAFTCHLAMLRAEQGRVAEVEEAMHDMIARFPALELAWRSGAAQVFGEGRLRPRAEAEFAIASANSFSDVPRNAMWLITLVFAAVASSLVGDQRHSEILYGLLHPYADRIAIIGYSVACLGSVSRGLGVLSAALGDWERAELHFEHSLAANTRVKSPLWVAHTLNYYARMLAARGSEDNRKRARHLAGQSLAIASSLELTNLRTNIGLLVDQLSRRSRIRFSLLA